MAETVEASTPTPYIEPAALGVPVSDFLDWFQGERCDEPPKQLRFELHDTENDATQIVRFLSRLSKAYARNNCVQHFARCLVSGSLEDNAQREQFDRVGRWVMENVVYQADPRGMEYTRSPVQMLREWNSMGVAYGDCDDHVLLVNSLLGALGIETKVVAVELPSQPGYMPGRLNHVLSKVRIGSGWRDFDACNKTDPLEKHGGERIEL